ncbi:RHS repeat-associated core domain-containing protein [Streptomyces sp. B-S-A6]|uniref:RHS repeat-associated core domain-containing protein n=1 Tax=Streptomyces cavernicola TaxID=3043613 RepID=A0ABT6SMC5_9ACTN|nr:RHS repeat-associated core domain-containing protein [Streptomyces sp. B-S-A6]MDI3409054.1 RHS repeat-associated core domain-containing protein [Streptomyces sp. B-S-A6]
MNERGGIAWRTRTTLWGATGWNRDYTAYTPLRFPGQYHDPETGLHYNFFRHYDPETGRYVTADPLGLEPADNPAAYVDNPTSWIDPLGLTPTDGCGESGGRKAQRRGEEYERSLQEQLGGGGSFKEGGREFDGAFVDEGTGRGTWYEAKSGEFWEKMDDKRAGKFFSTEGQKQQIAMSKGVDYMVISEREIPERVTRWLDKKGIPWRVIPME